MKIDYDRIIADTLGMPKHQVDDTTATWLTKKGIIAAMQEAVRQSESKRWIASKERLPDIMDGKHGVVWAWDTLYQQGHEEFYQSVNASPERWTYWMLLPGPPIKVETPSTE